MVRVINRLICHWCLNITVNFYKINQNVSDCEVPQSILYHTVFAGSPARAGMVALKYKRRLLIAELGEQTTLLIPQTQSIQTLTLKSTLQQNFVLLVNCTIVHLVNGYCEWFLGHCFEFARVFWVVSSWLLTGLS